MQFQKDTNNNRIRKRRIYYQDNTPESETGEMIYTDPNGNQVFSPFQDSQEPNFDYVEGEPNSNPKKTKTVFQTVRNDLKGNPDMVTLMSDQPFPSLVMNINQSGRNPQYQRSPQLLNMASSQDDNDYNIPTINSRQSPINLMYNNRDSNDDYLHSPYEDDDNQDYQNESEIRKTNNYSQNRSPQYGQRYRNNSPPGYGGVIPTNQMSPPLTFEEFNTSTDKANERNINNYNKPNNYLGNNSQTYRPNQTYQPRQGYENPNQTLKNPPVGHILRDDVSNKYNNQTYNNMSYKDIQRLANRFSKVYDPHKNSNGILLEESQVTLPGAQDEIFNNRYKVLSKMNRLSNILLANKRRNAQKNNEKEFITKTYNRNNSYNDNKKQFDRHTLARSPQDGKSRRAFSRSPNHKFLYVSLAMISSKGPQTEDRPILRWMRLEKGGVVDLAQEERKKNKFLIKKALPKKGLIKGFYTNPKYREKAAKIIQSWWRQLKNIYNDRLDKIIKIQSAFRGKFVRKYMYDLFYLNFLYISFCKKIENVLQKHIKPYVWDKLFNNENPQKKRKTTKNSFT